MIPKVSELPKEACDYQAIRGLEHKVHDSTEVDDKLRMLFVLYWKQASAYNKTRASYETFLAKTIAGSTGFGKKLKVLARNLYTELTKNTAKHELGNSPGIRNLGKMAYKLVSSVLLFPALRPHKLSNRTRNAIHRRNQRQPHELKSLLITT